MTEIVLVRHGQASFGGANYDVLSPLGHRQSSVLGAHWKQTGFSADACFSGAMARQKDTARRALADAGLALTATEDRAFDEYDFEGIIRGYLPLIAQEHPEIRLDAKALFKTPRDFQQVFEKLIGYWLSGRAPAQGEIESWTAFRARVLDGLRAIAIPQRKRVAVFTSGGVIAVALQQALKLSDEMTFRVNWRIANASTHGLRLGKSGLSLLGFNSIAHLELANDPALVTFR